MKKTTIILLVQLCLFISFGQTKLYNCKLPKNDPAHFDPYYNGHLRENFNPQQTDFSKEYLNLQTKRYAKKTNELNKSLQYDYSSIWQTDERQQNGIIGLNYQRIQFHIDNVTQSSNPDTYIVKGKSKVNKNICNFTGELKLIKLFYGECEDPKHKKCAELFGDYIFYEDSTQNHSGYFKGIMECSIYLDKTGKKMMLDESAEDADGYWNRTFVGTWTDYKTKKEKKCIWGDYRLPFTFDFDTGDGEMIVSGKYAMNGWKEYNDCSELIEVANGKLELKNKWWKTK